MKFLPGGLARVVLIALEETGAPYRAVRLRADRDRPPQVVDGRHGASGGSLVLECRDGATADLLAIICQLDRLHPGALLLPAPLSPARETAVADLAWLAGTLHPLLCLAGQAERFGDGGDGAMRLKQATEHRVVDAFARAESRLASRPWLSGERWHVPDALLSHCWGMRESAGIDFHRFPRLVDHFGRCLRRRSSRQSLDRETFG
ncbi:MAG: glutathione S-transferase family protein [Burkholderiales bacterium]